MFINNKDEKNQKGGGLIGRETSAFSWWCWCGSKGFGKNFILWTKKL